MKITINFVFILTILLLIPPIIVMIVLFSVVSFSSTITLPLILYDPNTQMGLIPITTDLTIWNTSLNWLCLLGTIIWMISAASFIISNTLDQKFKKLGYIVMIIGIFLTNFAMLGDIFIYGFAIHAFFPFILILFLGFISGMAGIYIKVSD